VVTDTTLPLASVRSDVGHAVQDADVAPPAENVPLEHNPVGAFNPVVAQYEPAGHGVALSVPPEHIDPTGHSRH